MMKIERRIMDLSGVVDDPRKHLRYYRNSLADGERMDIPAWTVRKMGCVVPLVQGLSETSVRKLFNDDAKDETRCAVLYCPLSLKPVLKDSYMSDATVIYPYWIPAVVDRSGALYPPENDTDVPWIIRGVLEPNEYLNRESPVLSSVERVDQVGMNVQISRDNWTVYLAGTLDYFKEQVGCLPRDLKIEGWKVDIDTIALISADVGGMSGSIIKLYDQLLSSSESRLPGVLHSLLTLRNTEPKAIDDPCDEILRSEHYGQMTNRFPLSPSQRVALALLDNTGANQVLAVNGPPGTGKTTLIQSVVADLVVKSFLLREKPPIIVGSSVNNQAITNILDSFASVSPDGADRTGLNERWLPSLDTLGHYLAANNADKLEKARDAGHWVSTVDLKKSPANDLAHGAQASTSRNDAYEAYLNANPSSDCTLYFIERMRVFLRRDDIQEIKDCKEIAHENVATLRCAIDRITRELRDVRGFVSAHGFTDATLRSLAVQVHERLEAIRERRSTLDGIIAQERLRARRPGFFLRLIDSVRFGNSDMRRSRVQAALSRRLDLSINLELRDLYDLSADVWSSRDSLFEDEMKLSNAWASVKSACEDLSRYASSLDPDLQCGHKDFIEAVESLLDVHERHDAFWWAVHGLECLWLMERNDNTYDNNRRTSKGWELRSFLTPVFVSTFHSLPNFFQYPSKSVHGGKTNTFSDEVIDLLVIDEAGQVAPELGVPAFALAKKALVVGDARQIEPIWNIPSESVDFSNGKRAGIIPSEATYEGFSRSGRSCVSGTLIALAQDASTFLYPPEWGEAGSLLVEHRRCVPEIIEYCNRFVYQSLLDVKTSPLISDWPALGYCHVGGSSIQHHGTRSNPVEARAIVAWIKNNRENLTKRYNASLADILAIITPFRGQRDAVVASLKAEGIYEKDIVVGTVHSLQGAEKPVVIFSPVYGRNHQRERLFFNQTYNMLNVAVSRAKNHFLVFGNMNLFRPGATDTPAGDLGKLLFRKPDNEISNDFLFAGNEINYFDQEPINRISDLNKHRLSLKKAIETAEKRLVIVSPFISINALQDDNIPSLLGAAIQRGVEILIFTDSDLDMVNGSLKPHAAMGRQALIDAGAILKIIPGIHNKTVILDRKVLIEGSFNWLSAVRDENSSYHRQETSIVLKEPYCEQFITRAEIELGIKK